jgi:tRNA pseudouridine synthase 10
MPDGPRLTDPDALRVVKVVPDGACDACLGRTLARLEPGQENRQRGAVLREASGRAALDGTCVVCEGITDRIGTYETRVLEAVVGYEFDTFLVGSRYFAEVVDRERSLWQAMLEADEGRLAGRVDAPAGGAPAWPAGEWLRNEVNRRVGRRLDARWSATVDLARPDMVVTVDTRADVVTLEPRSVYLTGRYRKHARDIPQTRWPCRSCQGIGCRACAGAGKRYPTSVEEEVAAPAALAAEAEESAFHGMGREDVDALMLGQGRPFVLEMKRPRRRRIDPEAVQEAVNRAAAGRVEVLRLQVGAAEDVAAYKAADPRKSYVARCRAERAVPQDKLLKEVESLGGVLLDQRTPARVSHRRADKVRRRRVRTLELLEHDGDRFDIHIEADAGTYIKELVSGDDGRTTPSFAERLGLRVWVEQLDVVAIHWEE